ncbi:MAG: carbohydrate ABC transporter permease [Saccharofermentanales bacterium]
MRARIIKKDVNRSVGGNIAMFVLLTLFGLFFMFPIVYAVNTAFKPMTEIFIFPPRLFVRQPTANNFIELQQMTASFWVPLSRYLFNSFFVSIVGTAGHLFFASMAAYPFAKHDFPGRNVMRSLIVLSLLFTASVTFLPQYIVLSQLGLVNTYGAVIMPALQTSLGLYLMINFVVTLPDEMIESARMDGAGEFRIYRSVIMPNVKPAWLTLMIFAFQGLWNSTGGSLIYREEIKMLPAILTQIAAGGIARTGVSSAAALILMIPPILIFIFSQNRVIETMSTSGLK